MTGQVDIIEVGPRDGLQNEPRVIAVADKVHLISLLAQSGLGEIEVGSFVSRLRVPQMADSDQVLRDISYATAARFRVLVPNLKGWQSYVATRAAFPPDRVQIAVFVSASEGFSRANLNCSVAESLENLVPVFTAAQTLGVDVRGYISCVAHCPFDGPTDPGRVAQLAAQLRSLGASQISLGDTIGTAQPDEITALLRVVGSEVPLAELAGHFHDTQGRALDNVAAALAMGLRVFDASIAGLGGCPFAPGAPENLATEQLVDYLHGLGYSTGVDPTGLGLAARFAKRILRQGMGAGV